MPYHNRTRAFLARVDSCPSPIVRVRKDPLTDRERLILRRAGDGETTAELAHSLRLTEGTVRNYLSEAISKLHASNRIEAARIARNKGWL